MNKKFSTLVASLLLATSVGTVSADVISGNFAKYGVKPGAVELIKAGTYYQIAGSNANQVMAMVPVPGTDNYTLQMVTANKQTDVRYTLWTIDVQGNPTDGYRYSFFNMGAQRALSIDTNKALKTTSASADAVEVSGDISLWKWQDAPDPVGGFALTDVNVLTSVFGANNDSTVTLAFNGTDVYAVKYALNNQSVANLSNSNQVRLVPAKPEAVVLGIDDLNSMLWSTTADGKLKLTFDKDVEGGNPAAVNLFTKQAYKAVEPVGYLANYGYIDPTNKGWKVGIVASSPTANDVNMTTYNNLSTVYVVAAEQETALKSLKSILGTGADYTNNQNAYLLALGALNEFHVTIASTWTTAFTPSKADFLKKLNEFEAATITGFDVNDPIYQAMKNAYANYVNNTVSVFGDLWSNASSSAVTALAISGNVGAAWDTEANLATAITTAETATTNAKTALDRNNTPATWKTKALATGWVSLQANSDETEANSSVKPTYLKVAKDFLTSAAGNKHLKFEIAEWQEAMPKASVFNATRQDLNGRYNFQFTWYPASDSIVIRTAGFAMLPANLTNWEDMTPVTNPNDLGLWKANAAAKETTHGTLVDIDATNLPFEQNLVKIAVLADNHREVTVGSSEYKAGADPISTINTKISINGNGLYTKTTLPEGVYYFNLVSNLDSRKVQNGKYIVANFCGRERDFVNPEVDQTYGEAQNFDHMPRTQWVIEQNDGPVAAERTINIYNREFPNLKATNLQLYKDEAGHVFALFGNSDIPFAAQDTLSYTKVSDEAIEAGLGYKVVEEKDLLKYYFVMDYYSGMGIGHKVNVSSVANDSVVYVNADEEAAGVKMQLVSVAKEGYGYKGDVVDQLQRQAYKIRIYDSSKLVNDHKYLKADAENEESYVLTDKEAEAAIFFLKENNQLTIDDETTKCYYALVEAKKEGNNYVTAANRVGVRDVSLKFSVEGACQETRVATFSLDIDNTPYYRRLGVTNANDGFADMDTAWAKIYDVDTHEYLYNDANSVYSKGKGSIYLGIENKDALSENPSLYVDTAYVRGETLMPQYMLAVDVTTYKEGKYCPYDPEHNTPEYLAEHPEGCPHAIPTPGYKIGRYLVNSIDSVKLDEENGIAAHASKYTVGQEYTRLHFVWAKHIEDTLVIMRQGPSVDLKSYAVASDSIFLGDNEHNTTTWTLKADPSKNTRIDSIRASHKNGIKNAVFAFRLVDDAPEADFLIESEGDKAIPSAGKGGWIKNQNGVPVIARYVGGYQEAALDALVFNVETSDQKPTDNEEISVSGVTVIAGAGQITINGAAGKKVVVSNILGQVVANTVLTSDNATIAAPQGVVVVAVEGEEAVKAIVK